MKLIVRADADPVAGAGHVMRCANLGEAWREIGPVIVWGAVRLPFVRRRLQGLGAQISPSQPADSGAVLVVDSYDPAVRADLARRAGPVLRVLVDDLGGAVEEGYDAVWNPNAYGEPGLYPGFSGRIVTGAQTVPVRSSLPSWTGAGEPSTGVLLGGGPPGRLLREALARLGAAEAFTGVGDWLPEAWERADPDDPWRRLATCGRLVLAAGTALWEASAVGVPALVLKTAANQRRVFRWAAGAGLPVLDADGFPSAGALARALAAALPAARSLPPISDGSAEVARRLHALARSRQEAAPDPRGALSFQLRPATSDDAELLFAWVNAPAVRQNALNPRSIAWDEHRQWLAARLAEPDATRIYVAEVERREPVGQIRFDRRERTGVISISIDPAHRGQGLGRALLRAGCRRILEVWPHLQAFLGEVRAKNLPSRRLFESFGFSAEDSEDVLAYTLSVERMGERTGPVERS